MGLKIDNASTSNLLLSDLPRNSLTLYRERRGIFFSTDALIAVIIILGVLLISFPVLDKFRSKSEIHTDILNTLSVLKVGDISSAYAGNGTEKSVLEQIGEYYISDPNKARLLAEEVLSDLETNENVGLWFGSTLVYSNNKTSYDEAEEVYISRRIISGLVIPNESEGSATGFSARAFLSSSLRNDYYYFGGYVGDGNISSLVNYDGDIRSAEMELVAGDDFDLYVNGIFEGNYAGSPSEFEPANYNFSITNFVSGDNIIEFRGDQLNIAGGFIKIVYEGDVQFAQAEERYYFPGVEGLVNIYDGFYVPNNLSSMEVSLHLDSTNASVFLNLGNETLFNGSTNGEEFFVIDNAIISSRLDYADLEGETLPLRLGLENVSYEGIIRDIDVFSVTDLSGSMSDCAQYSQPLTCHHECLFSSSQTCVVADENSCVGNVCEGNCFFGVTWDHYLDCDSTGIVLAQEANEVFIDIILNSSNSNRVGLVGYKGQASASDYHSLSFDDVSLKAKVNSWNAGGSTCICCGINFAVSDLLSDSNEDKHRSVVVMSDGQANVECPEQGVTGDLNGNGNADDAGDDAIQAACDAFSNDGIVVNSVGFGTGADEATLQAIASCGNGFYYYSDVDELAEIYQQIADNIIAEYAEQTISVLGNLHTRLYPDSYIDFIYTKPEPVFGLVVAIEKLFNNTYSGSFDVPQGTKIVEASVASYSGSRWTDRVEVNGLEIYNLANYGSEYISLGDPFIVRLENQYVNNGSNSVDVLTAIGPGNQSEGSNFNKIIYKLVKNVSAFSPIVASAEGCDWTIELESGGEINVSVPETYSGVDQCFYNSVTLGLVANENDALQIAVLNLLKELDLDLDGKIDVEFNEQDLQISVNEITGIPFTWATEVQARRWVP